MQLEGRRQRRQRRFWSPPPPSLPTDPVLLRAIPLLELYTQHLLFGVGV